MNRFGIELEAPSKDTSPEFRFTNLVKVAIRVGKTSRTSLNTKSQICSGILESTDCLVVIEIETVGGEGAGRIERIQRNQTALTEVYGSAILSSTAF